MQALQRGTLQTKWDLTVKPQPITVIGSHAKSIIDNHSRGHLHVEILNSLVWKQK